MLHGKSVVKILDVIHTNLKKNQLAGHCLLLAKGKQPLLRL